MFGIKHEDVDMAKKIWDAGFTVSDAIALRREGRLPPHLVEAWLKYEEWLKAESIASEEAPCP